MHSRSVIPWLLLVVLALIVYGSLYPFNFKPDAMQGGVLEALRQLSWVRAGRGDRISNVLLFCSRCNSATRTGSRVAGDGSKERFCRSCSAGLGQLSPAKTKETK